MAGSWHTVEGLFHATLERPESERAAFLREACRGDADLLQQIESLLRYHRADTEDLNAAVGAIATDLMVPSRAEQDLFGVALGPYRIDRKLGQGGMGAVYLATDTRLGRQVAIKLISRTFAGTPDAQPRFLREARSVAALSHPNIAVLYDFGQTEETPWLVMEYVSGLSLRSRLTGRLGENILLRYAGQIAAALEHAHSRGILHRDIKPENILVTEDDNVKLIDFGLARAVREQVTGASAITQPHTFIGTLAYSAPELLEGGSVSARSDVYSLGVVLYEMACGEQPFAQWQGPSLVAAILAGNHLACQRRNPSLTAATAALIERCLSRDSTARYRDGGEVAAALRNWATVDTTQQTEVSPPYLAIVDFTNIAGRPETDWLGTGVAETLSADLAKLRSVRVASRGRVIQAVRRVGNPQIDPGAAMELGRELAARWIVTGGFQQIGSRVRITPALIDATTGEVLATEKIDGCWEDLFDVQDRVVGVLMKALAVRFGTTDQQKILPAETRNMAAYEQYVRGRQQMYEMKGRSLSAAISHFEQAVSLDFQYALAHSALGTAYALQFIRTSSPEDIIRASGHLEKAIELDPELGEPYPWLANIRVRKNDPDGACAAGQRGVELQPDLPEAHYFASGLHYMLPEYRPGEVRNTPRSLAEAIRLQPKFHAAWIVSGAAAVFLGNYEQAIELLSEAVRMEAEPDLIYRFVGARTLLGIALMRAGAWDEARAQHGNALESLRTTDHVYTSCFMTLSACGLGDIELRRGNERDAMLHYRHAWRLIQESPRMVGSARLLIRASAGLAASYAATGERERARELADGAAAQMQSILSQSATVTFECSLAQLHLLLAAAELRLGRREQAILCLDRARAAGWQDWRWLLGDPELRPLQTHPNFVYFVEALQSAPAIDMQIPWHAVSASTAHA